MANVDNYPQPEIITSTGDCTDRVLFENFSLQALRALHDCACQLKLRVTQLEVLGGGNGMPGGTPNIGPVDLGEPITPPDGQVCGAFINGTVELCATISLLPAGEANDISSGTLNVSGSVELLCDGVVVGSSMLVSGATTVNQTAGNVAEHCAEAEFEFPSTMIPTAGCIYTVQSAGPVMVSGSGLGGANPVNPAYGDIIGEVVAFCDTP